MLEKITKSYLYLRGYRDDVSIGQCFHHGICVEQDRKKARMYYQRAAKLGDPAAFNLLADLTDEDGRKEDSLYYRGIYYEQLKEWEKALFAYQEAAEKSHPSSMCRLGQLFQADRVSLRGTIVIKKDLLTELYWYRRAAVVYSAYAINILVTRSRSEPQVAFLLGQMHEAGEIGGKKILTAVMYYEKACEMQHVEAAYRLGQLHEYGDQEFGKDLKIAFNYYSIAAEKRHQEALAAMEKLAKEFNDHFFWLKLGKIQQEIFNDTQSALKCLKYSADQGNKAARIQLKKIAQADSTCAYELGKSYEKDDRLLAYDYYVLAMHHHHNAAKNRLNELAKAGERDAQYSLGCAYHATQDYNQAIDWCMQAAEKNHPHAMIYLTETSFSIDHYLLLAQKYREGQGVKRNLKLSLHFYEKACALKSPEAAYQLGQLYEAGEQGLKKDVKIAFDYYLVAAQERYKKSLASMEKIAKDLNENLLWLKLGQIHQTIFNDELAALYCFKYSANQGNQAARAQLDDISQKDSEFAYLLGELYENDAKNDVQTALKYYLVASRQGHKTALRAVERLGNQLDDPSRLQLGQIYRDCFNDKLSALQCFKSLADKGDKQALAQMNTMTKQDTECIYLLAKLYEEEKDSLQKAYSHYAVAACKNHTASLDHLHAVANSGNMIAQCVLGSEYYHCKHQWHEAIAWCMLAAEKDYLPAVSYLTETQFSADIYKMIAKKYERGEEVKQNSHTALIFYEKAYSLEDQEAAFYLGQFYQVNHPGVQKEISLAFHFYLQAANYGSQDALRPLERLGDEVSAENQLALSQLYGTFFHNREKADYWCSKAVEVEQFNLKI
jgi:TPR repeat protein